MSFSSNHQSPAYTLLPRFLKPAKIILKVFVMGKQVKRSITKLPRLFQILIILLLVSALVFLIAILLGNLRYVSNLYFYASILLLILAIIPIVLELISSGKLAGKAVRKDENVSELLKEKQKLYEQRANMTYIFGFSGILSFLLSIFTSLII